MLQDPRTDGGVPDTSGILRILSLVTKIRVPFSCGWQGDGPLQDPPPKSPKKTTIKATQITTRRPGSKLIVPGGGDRPIRSRSKSPKNQKLSVKISASTAASREGLEANKLKKTEVGGPINFKEEELRSPCSITPFIKPSSHKVPAASNQTSVSTWERQRENLMVYDKVESMWIHFLGKRCCVSLRFRHLLLLVILR